MKTRWPWRVFVGTLYSGEQEFNSCVAALDRQSHTSFEHVVIRDRPNTEAHRLLYRTIMERSGEFDLSIKLDADMVFVHHTALADIVRQFEDAPELDHVVYTVRDWYSGLDIFGMHAFSPRVRWATSSETLFVDPPPEFPGARRYIREHPAPIAYHSPDPSLEEAIIFGAHRALKVVQRDRFATDVTRAREQYDLLGKVWERFVESNDPRRAAALLGAEYVFSGNASTLVDKSKASFVEDVRISLDEVGAERIRELLARRWTSGATMTWRVWRYIHFPRVYGALKRRAVKLRGVGRSVAHGGIHDSSGSGSERRS